MPKKNPTPKIWLFFEIDEKERTSCLRAVALDRDAKKRFEMALHQEMIVRNENENKRFKWTIEENLANHLYGHTMFKPVNIRWRMRKDLDGE